MIDIILGIISFNVILICFKLLGKYKVDNLQAISVNYLTAGTLSYFFSDQRYSLNEITQAPWLIYAIIVGFCFITVFNLLAKASQKIGMAVPTVANKMSVVIPVIAAFFLFNDSVTFLKILGITIALVGVYFASTSGAKLNFDKKYLWVILIIFFGQGLADIVFNLAQQNHVSTAETGVFFTVLFAAAGSLGLLFIIIQLIRKKTTLQLKSIFWGILVGVPNYLTLLFFFRSLESGDLESSQVYPIYNIGAVVLSAFVGLWLFKEKLSVTNWIGIALCVAAIAAIAIG